MQVISQEICACVSSMPVKNPKKAAFWPIDNIIFSWWLHNIQNNTNPILIIVSNNPLISIGSIPHNMAIFSDAALGWFPLWQIQSGRIRRNAVSQQQLLNIKWFIIGMTLNNRRRSNLRRIFTTSRSIRLFSLIVSCTFWNLLPLGRKLVLSISLCLLLILILSCTLKGSILAGRSV
jgi:hypothetical protein